MTDPELLQARMQKWRLDGQPVRTLDDARTFFESVGFCLMYPMRPAILVPTFIGAWVGADDKLPAAARLQRSASERSDRTNGASAAQ